MRIVLLSFHWVEYPVELANALVARGHEVTVLLSDSRVEATVGDRLHDLIDGRVDLHVFRNHRHGLRDPRQLATAAKLLRIVARARPDILHVQEVSDLVAGVCLPMWRNIPLVLTVHDVTPHPGGDSDESRRRERIRDRFRARADAIVVHGSKLRDRYLEYTKCAPDRVHAIPHGCYHSLVRLARTETERDPQAILFFGRVELYKGLGSLIRVYRKLRREFPHAKLIVAGKGTDLPNHLSDLAEMPECEVLNGYLSNQEVADVFQRSAIAVLPYTEGSESGVVRIAYPFGVPVVATDVGSIPESIDHGVTGFVVPAGDDGALYEAIAALLGDPATLTRMGDAASEKARNSMSWDAVAERQEAIFERLTRARDR